MDTTGSISWELVKVEIPEPVTTLFTVLNQLYTVGVSGTYYNINTEDLTKLPQVGNCFTFYYQT